jgi:hypothetical protein
LPIGLLNKDLEIKLMNWLDVGEFVEEHAYYNARNISKAINFKHDLDSN